MTSTTYKFFFDSQNSRIALPIVFISYPIAKCPVSMSIFNVFALMSLASSSDGVWRIQYPKHHRYGTGFYEMALYLERNGSKMKIFNRSLYSTYGFRYLPFEVEEEEVRNA